MKRYVLVISILTLLATLLLAYLRFTPKPYGDGEYHAGALALIQGTGFLFSKGWFPVVYYSIPYFICSVLGMDYYYEFAIVFNGIVNVIALSLVGVVLRNRFGLTAAYVFLIFSFLLPIHIYYSLGILAETPAFISICVFIYFIWRDENAKLSRLDLWAAVVALVCFLGSRQIYLSIFPIFLIYYLVYGLLLKHRAALDSLRNVMIISFVIFGVVQLGVNAIGEESDGEYKSYVFKNGLIISRSELRYEPLNWMHWTQKLRNGSIDFEFYKTLRHEFRTKCGSNLENCDYGYMVSWYLGDVWQNKLISIRQALAKITLSYTFFSSGALQKKIFEQSKSFVAMHVLINIVNYTILILFIWYLRLSSEPVWKHLSVIFILSGLTTTLLLHAESRYLFPARPFIFIGASIVVHIKFASKIKTFLGKYFRIHWEE